MSVSNRFADDDPQVGLGQLPEAAASGRHADEDASMTLSAERIRTSTEWVETRRVVLRRRIVTETRTVEVTLRREELVVDEVSPSSSAPATDSDFEPDHAQHEPVVIVLRQEVPDVAVRVLPYERVTARIEYVATDEAVQASVRHEEADFGVEPLVADPR